MLTKISIAGFLAATVAGMGTGALATTTDSPTSGHGHHHRGAALQKVLKRTDHGQLVIKGKDGTFVTHDLIHGTVTAVSATSISVVSAGKANDTFVVNKDTKVRMRATHSKSTIGAVHKGDEVFVLGTGDSTMTAKHVIDVR